MEYIEIWKSLTVVQKRDLVLEIIMCSLPITEFNVLFIKVLFSKYKKETINLHILTP